MTSTSSAELAEQIIAACMAGEPIPDRALATLAGRAVHDPQASAALFRIVVERMADAFEPWLCDTYARLFTNVIALARPAISAERLLERYQRVRNPRKVVQDPEVIYVLSRVTLGADVAVTSVVLDAAKLRFPHAEIRFVGPRKNWRLFEADDRIVLHDYYYQRGGTLGERLHPPRLDGGIVLDPDSRITQLGLLPVCPEDDYYFFESRSYGSDGHDSMTKLTQRWVLETLGCSGRPYVAPAPSGLRHEVTISLGVGENTEKRVAGCFEEELLRALKDRDVLIDTGAGGDETVRVESAIQQSGTRVSTWRGDYAPFASAISQSRLFIGYDSAGQHVAAARGVPLVTIFAGHVSKRFFERWQPTGPGPKAVVQVTSRDPDIALHQTLQAVSELTAA